MEKLSLHLLLRKYENKPLPICLIPYLLWDEGMHLWFCSGSYRAEIFMSEDRQFIHVNSGTHFGKHPVTNPAVLFFMLSQFSGTLLDEVLSPATPYSFSAANNYPGATTAKDNALLGRIFLTCQ